MGIDPPKTLRSSEYLGVIPHCTEQPKLGPYGE